MNRGGRDRLRRTSEALYNSIQQSMDEYRQEVEALKADEEEKLARLPETLADSVKGDGIRDSLELLDDVSKGIDRIEDALEDLVGSTLDYSFSYCPVTRPQEGSASGLKRDMRFQALLPKALVDKLRFTSSMTGLSKNELLIRALDSYL